MIEQSLTNIPAEPRQQLTPHAYTSTDWYEREQKELFGRSWIFAGVTSDLANAGDYVTVQVGHHPLIVVRGRDGEFRGFHNLCRHRGSALLEGSGNTGNGFICPYHAWSYDLDGTLTAVTNQAACFPDLDKAALSLHPAAVGVFRGVVFVHPDPDADFDAWLADLPDAGWPHDVTALTETRNVTYEMKCNWKAFYENAVDGYHLKYLHQHTLGGPAPDRNTWDAHGRHLVWYATDSEGGKRAISQTVARYKDQPDMAQIRGTEAADYGGVFMLFPTTIVLPNPYNFSITQMLPVAPEITLLHSRVWGLPGTKGRVAQDISASEEAVDPLTGYVNLDYLTVDPRETGDHQLEDMWICENIQRAMHSPKYSVAGLGRGAGAEAPLTFFQQSVLDFVPAQ